MFTEQLTWWPNKNFLTNLKFSETMPKALENFKFLELRVDETAEVLCQSPLDMRCGYQISLYKKGSETAAFVYRNLFLTEKIPTLKREGRSLYQFFKYLPEQI